MIVKCPSCETAYKLDDRMIKPGGSKFRCSHCSHVFKILPSAPPSPSSPTPVSPPPPDTGGGNGGGDGGGFANEGTVTQVDFSDEAFGPTVDLTEQYLDLGSIGEGGMGEVRLAKDNRLLRKVAVKVLKRDAAKSQAALRYFIREAQITAQLDHPNIVPLYTVKPPTDGEESVSFVMKLIKGKTFLDIITSARSAVLEDSKAELPSELTLESRLAHFLKVCEGIMYAHRKQVIHRDLKPANIMIGDYGEVYIMDWGIAKMLRDPPETLMDIQKVHQESSRLKDETQEGSVVGTLGYISPEQVKGLTDVGPASDQFSLGVILQEIVTLNPARTGNMAEKKALAEGGYLNPIEHVDPEYKIPPELKAIIARATEVDPEDRYPSVSAMAEDVRRYLRGEEVSEFPDNFTRRMWRVMNKHRYTTLVVILCTLIFFSGIAIFSLYREQMSMKAARLREIRLTKLLSNTSTQAYLIDKHFIRLEDLLMGLANSAVYLLEEAPPNNERFYWIQEFNNPDQDPTDHVYSSLYKKQVSIDYPVVKLSPGTTREEVTEIMHRLAPLRFHYKRTLLNSRGSYVPLPEEEVRRLLTVHGVPITWIYIGLELGVMYSYPGKGTYSPEYDPRKRPWYELGAHKNSVRWGNPYIDAQGLGMVLPCALSLYGMTPEGERRFYGVLGADITYSNIIRENLRREGAVGVVESFLLDEQGRIVVGSSQLEEAASQKPAEGGLKLDPFPVEAVVKAIQNKESGLVEVRRENEKRLVVYQPIPSLNWYYVEELRADLILESLAE